MPLQGFGGVLPSAAPSKGIEFAELEALRKHLETIRQLQVISLREYYEERTFGFQHRRDISKGGLSIASTCTCVSALVAAGKWPEGPWKARSGELAEALLTQEWTSAGLPPDNVFSTAFVLEAVTALGAEHDLSSQARERLSKAEELVIGELADGSASVDDYPPSAYLTQLAVRVLQRRERLPQGDAVKIAGWAWGQVHHQLALLEGKSKSADPYQLAYSLMIAAQLGEPDKATPDEALVMKLGLARLFAEQLPDGTWSRSQSLFHYPRAGTAHCYEYEMLVQLLSTRSLEDQLLKYLPNLSLSAYALGDSAFELGGQAVGWASGHHPQFQGPESWSTASVFHFAHGLDRLLAEAIRQWIFDHLDTAYIPPKEPQENPAKFGEKFLDCQISVEGGGESLRKVIFDHFVEPVARDAVQVREGGALAPDTPMSAIFFGPPGTSKTELTRLISDYVGWPQLAIDPSYFVRNGMDQIQAEASRLFGLLSIAEGIVVLLDEFDEMVRDRSLSADVLSRFLTTGMLPKLARMNRNRRLVFIVATNYIDNFDLAISRQGRFDLILQVMPPTTAEKLQHWKEVPDKLRNLGVLPDSKTEEILGDLTFLEFKTLAKRIERVSTPEDARQLIDVAHARCTLRSKIKIGSDEQTWKEVSEHQQSRIRLPQLA